ncbi:MAG: NAD(P)H-quinone oxidoreductase [Pseudomonadota bacterium]
MKAIQVDGEHLVWRNTPRPEIGTNDVLVRNYATAINRADLMQRAGLYPPPPGASDIMGLECAGVIEAAGSNVKEWKKGDRVCALLAGGGYAQYSAVPQGQLLPIPGALNFEQATALPEVFATAYLNIYIEAAAQPGERVLLHAGASGVGTAAIQLCSVFSNPCMVTVGGADKIEYCQSLGASAGFDRRADDSFVTSVKEWAGDTGVDVILDPVGASYLADNQQCLAVDGRIVVIGLMGGLSTELNLGAMLIKRQRIIGSTLRSRSLLAKAELISTLREHVWPQFSDGTLKPVIEKILPIEEMEQAHALVGSNKTIGKVVLSISQD